MKKKVESRLAAIVFVMVVIVGFVFFFRMDVSANDEAVIEYQTIKVEKGDTVWEIAKEYYWEPCGDIRDYVYEIKECNQLEGYRINEGCYLCIPVYTKVER